MKGKGLLFSKLPRATEIRHLSRQGKSKWMDSQGGAWPHNSAPHRENAASHTEVSL